MADPLRILVVDDDDRMTHTIKDILALKGYATTAVHSAAEALAALEQASFDCVLTDIRMPGMNGVDLFFAIHEGWPTLPVVLMTAFASEQIIQQALAAGAAGLFEKPLDINHLLAFFAELRKESTITVVDDDPAFCQTIVEILELRGYKVRKITNPLVSVAEIVGESQVLLLDMKLNGTSGSELLRLVRAHYPSLPVVLITGYRQEMAQSIQAAYDANVQTCLYKPLIIPDLLKVLTEIRERQIKALLTKNDAA
jgi:CheY-like chemotaxis protein